MAEQASVDRAAIRALVEDNFRCVLAVAREHRQIAHESIDLFYKALEATASLMASERAEEFLKVVQEEQNIFIDEFRQNPTAVEQRLGLRGDPARPSHRSDLADVGAGAAVRVTMKESVDPLFGVFR